MKNQFAVATQIARKSGPWVGAATCLLIAVNDLRTSKKVTI